jgi:flagellin
MITSNININQQGQFNSLEKLSSMRSINKASDNASGLVISDKLSGEVSALQQGIENANSSVSMIQIADQGISNQKEILTQIKDKLINASTATTSNQGREGIAKDINKMLEQFDNIAEQTNYNGGKLLEDDNGDHSSVTSLYLDEEMILEGNIQSNTDGTDLSDLKSKVSTGEITSSEARSFISNIDKAIDKLGEYQSNFGSAQNSIESSTRNMISKSVQQQEAASVIRDTNVASEVNKFNTFSLNGQIGTMVSVQANASAQNVLKLLT